MEASSIIREKIPAGETWEVRLEKRQSLQPAAQVWQTFPGTSGRSGSAREAVSSHTGGYWATKQLSSQRPSPTVTRPWPTPMSTQDPRLGGNKSSYSTTPTLPSSISPYRWTDCALKQVSTRPGHRRPTSPIPGASSLASSPAPARGSQRKRGG